MALPPEIVREILLKERPKSLIRFKSLCKEFRNLIESPNFIYNHLLLLNISSSYLVFAVPESHGGIVLMNATKQATALPMNVIKQLLSLPLLSSSDGLLCFTDVSSRYYLLWSPLTMRSLMVPRSQIASRKTYWEAFGMGLAPAGTIKLVRIVRFSRYVWGRTKNHCHGWVKVPTSEIRAQVLEAPINGWTSLEPAAEMQHAYSYPGCWREIPFLIQPCHIRRTDDPVRVGTALHWETKAKRIVAFDLVTELFTQFPIPMPAAAAASKATRPHSLVAAYNGKLAVFLCSRERKQPLSTTSQLWVMQEYGNARSWTMMFKIRLSPLFHQPMTIWNSQILMQTYPCRSDYLLLLYDPLSKTTKEIDICNQIDVRTTDWTWVDSYNYMESLLGS